MTDTDMIEAMARAIYERVNGSGCRPWRQIDHKPAYRDQATAAIAVVQPEIDRLRAENVELAHCEKVRSAAINKSLTDAQERADEANTRADFAHRLFDQREEILAALGARNAELRAENVRLRSAGTDALTVLKFAFNRIHVLPRSRDTELANDIDKVLGRLRAALSAPALDGEGR